MRVGIRDLIEASCIFDDVLDIDGDSREDELPD
jgi:hypothetical protein